MLITFQELLFQHLSLTLKGRPYLALSVTTYKQHEHWYCVSLEFSFRDKVFSEHIPIYTQN